MRQCWINLRDYTDFDWDTVYVFQYWTSEDEIAQVIGQRFPRYEEFQTHIAFVLNGRLVHTEAIQKNVERPSSRETVFHIAPGASFWKFAVGEMLSVGAAGDQEDSWLSRTR